MTEQEIREVAKTAAREVASEILEKLGVDPIEPFEMQRDFQHLRSWRLSTDAVKRQGLLTAVVVVMTGLLGALWLYIKSGGASH